MFRRVGLCISLLLMSCQPLSENAQALKKSLFAEGCTAPCWIGIQPGVTNVEDAKEILNKHYGQDVVLDRGPFEWSGGRKNNLDAGYAIVYDNIIQEIYILFNIPVNQKEFISILEEPTHVQVTGVNTCLGVNLWFKDDGIEAFLGYLDGTFKGVKETQPIWGIWMRTIKVTQELQVYDAAMIEWDGYKDYCEIVFGG